MPPDHPLNGPSLDRVIDLLLPVIESVPPEERASACLLMASRLVERAAYYAVQNDPAAPRVHLFDLAGHLDAASDTVGGGVE